MMSLGGMLRNCRLPLGSLNGSMVRRDGTIASISIDKCGSVVADITPPRVSHEPEMEGDASGHGSPKSRNLMQEFGCWGVPQGTEALDPMKNCVALVIFTYDIRDGLITT
jgi:hypothetical protein